MRKYFFQRVGKVYVPNKPTTLILIMFIILGIQAWSSKPTYAMPVVLTLFFATCVLAIVHSVLQKKAEKTN